MMITAVIMLTVITAIISSIIITKTSITVIISFYSYSKNSYKNGERNPTVLFRYNQLRSNENMIRVTKGKENA